MNVPFKRILAASGLVLLTACTGQAQPAAVPPVPSIDIPPNVSGTVSSAVPQTPVEQPPNSPNKPGPGDAPQPVVSGSGECKAADLTVSVGGGDAAAGTVYRSVVFTNKSDKSCTMQGFPGVSYVTGDDGHQVGPAAVRVGVKGAAITLAPGAKAQAPVGFVQVGNFDPAVCRPTSTRGLRIYPPHDTASMFLPLPGNGCAGTPPGQQLSVKTVGRA
ncbi:DUF4232 domain-containing protein [Actinocrispum wychmicini]|uniref:Uncharacterized protein DUF4232 n=1 Tax=Actinocrispum wychmicini TaxID=1213861 RepID=A0A4R2JYU2_9PSEU|nr:DUF4232 domain-containing protein [Actinocrispum wychmicini]TCO64507.1 uncharacterized protein DUF4232 [Actinocrispum wychmicini]